MNILVTGAAGFIGSHLAERLAQLGHFVRGMDCLTDYYSRELKQCNVQQIKERGVVHLPLDLSEADLSDAVRGVEIVYHLAAQPGISATTAFGAYVRNNLVATQRLLEAVKKSSRLRCLVNVSTSSVYGCDATGDETTEPKPTSYYGVTKLAAEQLVLSYARDQGLPACSMRLFSVFGPRERPEKLYPQLIRCILKEREFPLHEGSEKHLRSFTYVGDIVEGLVAVLSRVERCSGEIFNLGSETAITTGDGIRIVEEIMGRRAKIVRKPKRPGDQLKTHANIKKARRILGYNPRTSAKQGLMEEVQWYKNHIFGTPISEVK